MVFSNVVEVRWDDEIWALLIWVEDLLTFLFVENYWFFFFFNYYYDHPIRVLDGFVCNCYIGFWIKSKFWLRFQQISRVIFWFYWFSLLRNVGCIQLDHILVFVHCLLVLQYFAVINIFWGFFKTISCQDECRSIFWLHLILL